MELITQAEAASILKVSIRTITRYRQAGLLQTVKINRQTIRIPKLSVEKFIGESQWEEKQKIHTSSAMQTETFTSCLTPTDVAREIHFGQKIWKSQRLGSRVG